ncbi:CRISPR-associated endonuclease Cas2 [Thermaerobacter litoralis]
MFVILVYDVHVKRVAKVLKTCREYLTWVQNSVFEGEISEGKFKILWKKLEGIIDKEHDSILAYVFESMRYSRQQRLGIRKGGEQDIL